MAKKPTKPEPFSANREAQSIYHVINDKIKDLPNPQAIAILEEVSSHCDSMAEAMQEEEGDEVE